MGILCFQDLNVWKAAHRLTLDIYKVVGAFPAEERYCLSLQMRRAAISIPANIAEGFGRRGPKDQRRFYNISRGSAEELKYFLLLASDLGFLKDSRRFQDSLDQICAMLHRMIVPKA